MNIKIIKSILLENDKQNLLPEELINNNKTKYKQINKMFLIPKSSC